MNTSSMIQHSTKFTSGVEGVHRTLPDVLPEFRGRYVMILTDQWQDHHV